MRKIRAKSAARRKACDCASGLAHNAGSPRPAAANFVKVLILCPYLLCLVECVRESRRPRAKRAGDGTAVAVPSALCRRLFIT